MAFTPNSSTSAYVTPAEFLLRKDLRLPAMLVNDAGGQATEAELQTHPVLLAILKEASGMLESACVAGSRYTAEDIRALITAGTNAGEMLKGVISDVAAHRLSERRWQVNQDTLEGYRAALEFLQRLRDGVAVLPFDEIEAASQPDSMDLTQAEITSLNAPSRNTRAFGVRGSWGPRRY